MANVGTIYFTNARRINLFTNTNIWNDFDRLSEAHAAGTMRGDATIDQIRYDVLSSVHTNPVRAVLRRNFSDFSNPVNLPAFTPASIATPEVLNVNKYDQMNFRITGGDGVNILDFRVSCRVQFKN